MIKNKIYMTLFFLVLCVLAALLIKVQRKEIQNLDSSGKNIICFGDSLTFGYGAASGEDYPSALAKMVDRPVINAGVDADTTTEALKRLESDVLTRDPFLVIVEFGGNDFLRQVPQETTVKNIKEIVEKIQAKGAMVAIVDISAGFFMRDYRLAFYNLSREIGAIFIPSILNNIITNPSMKSDFLHPNNSGYKIIADTVFKAIKPYLKAA